MLQGELALQVTINDGPSHIVVVQPATRRTAHGALYSPPSSPVPMWPLYLLLALTQGPISQQDILDAEQKRDPASPVFAAAMASGDSVLQSAAVRAAGRLRSAALNDMLDSALGLSEVSVKREAARAAGLTGAVGLLFKRGPIARLSDAGLRAESYEALGRSVPVDGAPVTGASVAGAQVGGTSVRGAPVDGTSSAAEGTLIQGLSDSDPIARRGAARGLEVLARRMGRGRPLSSASAAAMAAHFLRESDSEVRASLLLALNSAANRDSMVVASAIGDSSAEIRRLGVQLGRVWVEDRNPQVRWQALRLAGNCDRAVRMLEDPSEHVRLLALDILGERHCGYESIPAYSSGDWQLEAHAVVALVRNDAVKATDRLGKLALSDPWQARMWAAQAAKLAGDTALLDKLARDEEPNVALTAMYSSQQALAALGRNHAGLFMAAANMLARAKLEVDGVSKDVVIDSLRAAFERINKTQPVTWRDAKLALVQAVAGASRAEDSLWLRRASEASELRLREQPALPDALSLAALKGARARVQIRSRGSIVIRLLSEEAPLTVHTFVSLAESGAYSGKTLHRVVPNFVLQGGSPGADEYDPATDFFMRDEVGGRHLRGTFGISTRGPDTGDGQFFINLVNNQRLDMDYTVFAETVSGLDVMDQVQEGDVIESIVIERVNSGLNNSLNDRSGDAQHTRGIQ